MRFDRLATLYLANPIRKVSPLPDAGCVSILMYHRISGEPEPDLGPYYKVNTSPRRFAEQMAFLAEERYKVVDLHYALELLKNREFSRKHVVITFDDGYADFYTHAWPILARHKFTATMYLPTSFIGQRTQQFRAAPCLTWDQVRELSKKGIRFGSHTVSHPKLIDLDWDEIQRELTESKFTLEQQLGRSVVDFAYPFAYPDADTQFVSRFTEALQKSGYENCATTIIGKAMSGDSPLALKRLPVNDCDDISLFAAKLEGAYNWLAIPQRLKKIRAHKAAASGTLSP